MKLNRKIDFTPPMLFNHLNKVFFCFVHRHMQYWIVSSGYNIFRKEIHVQQKFCLTPDAFANNTMNNTSEDLH